MLYERSIKEIGKKVTVIFETMTNEKVHVTKTFVFCLKNNSKNNDLVDGCFLNIFPFINDLYKL